MNSALFNKLNRGFQVIKKLYTTTIYIQLFCYLFFYMNILLASDNGHNEVGNASEHSKSFGSDHLTGELSSGSPKSQCQGELLNWVKEDLKDSPFTVDFKNKNSQCLAQIQKSKVSYKRTNEVLAEMEMNKQLDYYFQTRLVSSYLKRSFDECADSHSSSFIKNSMTRRFYFSALKTEASNSQILDEIAYYDSILKSPYPQSSQLAFHGVDCSTPFLNVKDKCELYKKSILKCKEALKDDKVNSLVNNTKDSIEKIEGLKFAHRKCLEKTQIKKIRQSHLLKNTTNPTCEPLLQAITLLEDKVPWLRGSTFQSLAIIQKPSYHNGFRTGYDSRPEKLKLAIINQMEENRQALLSQFKKNNFYFDCLMGMPRAVSQPLNRKQKFSNTNHYEQNQNSEMSCDPVSLTNHYIHQPEVELRKNLPHMNSDKSLSYIENELKNENCLLKAQNDIYQLNKKISDHGMTILLTGASLGVSGVAGRMVIKAANSLSQSARSMALVNGVASGFWAGSSIRQNLKDCRKESEAVVKLSSDGSVFNSAFCESSQSPIEQALARENHCLQGVLLSAPSLLPFVGAIPGLVLQSKHFNKLSLIGAGFKGKSTASRNSNIFTASDASEFAGKIAQISSESRKYVRVRTQEEYQGILENGGKLFLNSNKTVGYGITKEGELISVFKLIEDKGQLASILDSAARNGATYLTVLKGSPAEKAYLQKGLTHLGEPFSKALNEYTSIELAWGAEQAAKLVRQKMKIPNQ